jgi:CrcB protein
MPQAITSLPTTTVLWVALGGAIGSALRFGISEWMRRIPALASLPWATLTVNVVGSLVLGWFLRWAVDADVSPQLRAFVAIGACGGFTTFSTFAFETVTLLESGYLGRAMLYGALSVGLSLAATIVGFLLARA